METEAARAPSVSNSLCSCSTIVVLPQPCGALMPTCGRRRGDLPRKADLCVRENLPL